MSIPLSEFSPIYMVYVRSIVDSVRVCVCVRKHGMYNAIRFHCEILKIKLPQKVDFSFATFRILIY